MVAVAGRFHPGFCRVKIYRLGYGMWSWHHGQCVVPILVEDGRTLMPGVRNAYGDYYDTHETALEAALEHLKERHV